ncbi:putative E3 ubiquitin-protein ligase makorin-2 [Aphelenchoides fujianensis]|nr:putative E3 ubiquitin-protein ligase makorin-2 [Aphelenchoides fujianensis]
MERQRFCRNLANGRCADPACSYGHLPGLPEYTCRHFLNGYCRYGYSCWYGHPDMRPRLHGGLPRRHAGRSSHPARPAAHVRGHEHALQRGPAVDADAQSQRGRRGNAAQEVRPVAQREAVRPADAGQSGGEPGARSSARRRTPSTSRMACRNMMCPYFEAEGECNEEGCMLVHGDKCDMCDRYILHPTNGFYRAVHKRECLEEHEKEMARAFANQLSAEKQCGICMENIHQQAQRFGILNNCKHSYCLQCIRSWRKTTGTVNRKTTRSCPECRIVSDFVIPSAFWVEEPEEKKQLIDTYIKNMKEKVCKYMRQGNVDDCPFGNKCFYKHQLPDGRIVQAGAPRRRRRPSTNLDESMEISIDDLHWLRERAPLRSLELWETDSSGEDVDLDAELGFDEYDLAFIQDIEFDLEYQGELDLGPSRPRRRRRPRSERPVEDPTPCPGIAH